MLCVSYFIFFYYWFFCEKFFAGKAQFLTCIEYEYSKFKLVPGWDQSQWKLLAYFSFGLIVLHFGLQNITLILNLGKVSRQFLQLLLPLSAKHEGLTVKRDNHTFFVFPTVSAEL